jgi:anaerobic selenocysteine-containing dehydrogenase
MGEHPSRRRFLRDTLTGVGGAAALSGVGVASAPPQAPAAPPGPKESKPLDFTRRSSALEPTRTVRSACQFCNSLCALDVDLKDGRIVDVRGVTGDRVQHGELCVKADLMTELVYNPYRLKTPMKRVAGAKGSSDSRFEPTSWDEAYDIIARKLIEIRDQGDAHAVANKTSGRMPRGAGAVIGRFFALYGSPNDADVGPVCNDAGGNALAQTFGLGNFTNGYGIDEATGREDLGSARLVLLFGTNQAETHPVTFAHILREKQRRGARMVCVDPRQTPTAAQADEWIAIKPHTDLALTLGMLGHILANNLHDRAFVDRWVVGFSELKTHIQSKGYTPEWAAPRCDVPAAKIRALAELYARTKPAAIFCNAGISHQVNAFTTYRTLAILAAVTGNIGVPGGGCNFMHNTWPGGLELPPIEGQTPPRRDALPVGPDSWATSILEGEPYRLRAVITCGNPLLASANTEKVKRAYAQLEFYVYTGLFREESALYADVLLPVASGFETKGVYMRRDDRAIRWQEAAVPRVGESRTDWEIWIGLAHAMARHDRKNAPEYWTRNFPLAWNDYSNLWAEFSARTPGVGGMSEARLKQRDEPLRWPCPANDHPGTSTLYLDHPRWYAATAALGRPNARFLTPSGKVEIYTAPLDEKLRGGGHGALPVYFTHPEVAGATESIRYGAPVKNPLHPNHWTPKADLAVAPPPLPDYPLMGLIGRSSVVHFAGVTHWTLTGKHLNGVRFVQIHPDAAKAAGLREGDDVIVESPRGAVRGRAQIWAGIRSDTIFVPNGFGWEQVVGDAVGVPRYIEAANVLLDDRYFYTLSGQQAYKCFACRVRKT